MNYLPIKKNYRISTTTFLLYKTLIKILCKWNVIRSWEERWCSWSGDYSPIINQKTPKHEHLNKTTTYLKYYKNLVWYYFSALFNEKKVYLRLNIGDEGLFQEGTALPGRRAFRNKSPLQPTKQKLAQKNEKTCDKDMTMFVYKLFCYRYMAPRR